MFAFLISVSFLIVQANTLECGVIMTDANKDINQVIANCLIPTLPKVEVKVDNVTRPKNASTDDDLEEPPSYGPRRGLNDRFKRQDEIGVNMTLIPTTTFMPMTTQSYNNDTLTDPKKCVVHCIFKNYSLLDTKGYPELQKISDRLLASAEKRELKDFLQDSIDECFIEMSEGGEDLEPCIFSARLLTCLANKGRYNCADWPIGELPFPHKF